MKHHHVPAIERALPMERIIGVFEEHFGDPYLNPMAELTFEQLTAAFPDVPRSEEHTSELQSQSNLVCRLLLEKKKKHTFAPVLLQPPPYEFYLYHDI